MVGARNRTYLILISGSKSIQKPITILELIPKLTPKPIPEWNPETILELAPESIPKLESAPKLDTELDRES